MEEARKMHIQETPLEPIGTITVPALLEFSLRMGFVSEFNEDKSPGSIVVHGREFLRWFGELIEEVTVRTKLRCSGYTQYFGDNPDDPILEELGDRAWVTLGQINWLLANSDLLSVDHVNVFYAYDVTKTLRRIWIAWQDNAWHAVALGVNTPFEEEGGRVRVFSLDS